VANEIRSLLVGCGTENDPSQKVCPQCQTDETATPENKRAIWTIGVKFNRHQIQFRDIYRYSNRYLRINETEGEYLTPLGSMLSLAGWKCRWCQWSTVGKHQDRVMKHLVQHHSDRLSTELRESFDPVKRRELKKRVAQRLADEIGGAEFEEGVKKATYARSYEAHAFPWNGRQFWRRLNPARSKTPSSRHRERWIYGGVL
jgi:hypothetical protein